MLKSIFSLLAFVISTACFAANPPKNVVTYGPVKIEGFYMQQDTLISKVIHAKPGQTISAYANYVYSKGNDDIKNQIIVGLDHTGAQVAIFNGQSSASGGKQFKLIAPRQPGIYEVRFRYAAALNENDAVNYWWDFEHSPSDKATIGIIVVDGDIKKDPEWASILCEENLIEYLAYAHPPKPIHANCEIYELVTKKEIKAGFWSLEEKKGSWAIAEKAVAIGPTFDGNDYHFLRSRAAYQNFDLSFKTKHTITNSEIGRNYARGFSFSYFVDENTFVKFHYYPDIHQASLFIHDREKEEEHVKALLLKEGSHKHHISIKKGWIEWEINGKVVFAGKHTNLEFGKLMLCSHNNALSVDFD